MNGKTVVMGMFDSEKFWRDEKSTKLPEIIDNSSNNIVSTMDELLFPLCGKEDLLLTRYRFQPELKSYLDSIGISFNSNEKDLLDVNKEAADSKDKCVFELLNSQRQNCYFKNLLKGFSTINTYAILPNTASAYKNWGLGEIKPAYEIVKKVNSKIYSHEVCERIGIKNYGMIINKSNELEKAAVRYGNGRGFLIKDPYGVSGKGNLLISSRKMLGIIEKYLAFQEGKGLSTRFLVEPYHDKVHDFSCQIIIGQNGKHEVLSVQDIYNQYFSYSGSMSADREFIDFLDDNNYFNIIRKTAGELAGEGYIGNVCIDSMILQNGEIVPIVEINARKSMGLINYYLDKFLAPFSAKSYLSFFSAGYKNDIKFDEILSKFRVSGLLFCPEKGSGLIPLSCNTLFINRNRGQTSGRGSLYMGKFYFSAAANLPAERQNITGDADKILKSLNLSIYN